jgi:cytidylate kinase
MSAHGTRTRAHPVIAIDGPAGSGKSTVSRALAERLGVDRLDTGAMYRAVAWAALERGIEPTDRAAVAELARAMTIGISERIEADGTDITEAIRGPRVSRAVSAVAANPEVRTVLVQRQRQWVAERGGGIVEGRDIGSVVFPHADIKIYLTASADERARRRPEEGADAVARRDRLDSTRTASPLGVADGARVIDTTDRPVEEIVDEVVAWL